MNIVIPMAGLGKRFLDAGYKTHKSLIDINGKPMYSWAVDSLPISKAYIIIFILLKTNKDFTSLKEDIKHRYDAYNIRIIEIDQLTRGQAETVLKARDFIDNDESLIIHNSDTSFICTKDWITDVEKNAFNGALLVFNSNETRWSYVKEDNLGYVSEVREKQVISNYASTGTYYFYKGSDFVMLASEAIKSKKLEGGEFYVGPLYNEYIANGARVKKYMVDSLFCFGTPEDLKRSKELLIKNKA